MAEKSTAVQPARSPSTLKVVEPKTLVDRINRIYDSIARRAFEIFESSGGIFGRDLEDWFKAEAELLHPVHVDMKDKDAAITVRAEVPGFSAGDLEISVEPRRLVISGKRETKEEEKKGKTIYCECSTNELLRVLDLPTEVNTAGVTATLSNGVLELELPKVAKSKTVPISTRAT